MSRPRTPTSERLLRRRDIDPETGCWNWTGYIDASGYGQVRMPDGPRTLGTHRVSYETFVGPIPDGLHLDHLCRNRACFNPEHLEPVTVRENNLRAPTTITSLNLAKTHCNKGHEFTEANTILATSPNGRPSRVCRTCRYAMTRAYKERKRAEKAQVVA